MSPANPLPRDPRPHRRIRASLRAGLVWGVAASAVNLALWLVARGIGVPMRVWPDAGGGGQPISLGPLIIVGATLFASILAGLVVGLLAMGVRKVVRWVVVLGLLMLVASLSGPWGQPDAVPTATRVVLTLMHVATAVLVTVGLARGIWADDRAVVA